MVVKYCSNCKQILDEEDTKVCPACKNKFKDNPYIEDENLIKIELHNTAVNISCKNCSFHKSFKVGSGHGFGDNFAVFSKSLAFCPKCKSIENYSYVNHIETGQMKENNLCPKCDSVMIKIDLYKDLNTDKILYYISSKFYQVFPECPECHKPDLSVEYGKYFWIT